MTTLIRKFIFFKHKSAKHNFNSPTTIETIMENTMLQNLEYKTDKSTEQWIEIAKKAKLEKHKEMIDYLKSNHSFTYGFAT